MTLKKMQKRCDNLLAQLEHASRTAANLKLERDRLREALQGLMPWTNPDDITHDREPLQTDEPWEHDEATCGKCLMAMDYEAARKALAESPGTTIPGKDEK